jgi:hypothetical protein
MPYHCRSTQIGEGDPCEARAHHGFNGIEDDMVARIAAWITAR